ncbi:tyrosine-type recombinase/integrase [Ruthenibacterium lactatiformans]|uniref:tyrosine-type recombinase/integrase n=3 Tax=Oscillospiraceae TaxID=216572 RepID=UPI001FC8E437|nr:site-specific integrase [Ruthenibacterium lactatiformans]
MPAYKDKAKGTWYASFYYEDWTGKKVKKMKRGFPTKREALEWERTFLQQQTADLEMTFENFVAVYVADMKGRIKENTWGTKEHILYKKLVPYFGKRKMCDIHSKEVIAWQNEMLGYRDKNGKPYSPVYLKTLHNQLSAVFNHAVRHYNLKVNPAAQAGNMGKPKGREMLFWTKAEYLKFAEAMMDKPLSYYAFEMLYWCGVREGELLALTPGDFDFEKQTVTISKSYQRIKGKDVITDPKTPKENQVESQERRLKELAPAVKNMERLAADFSANPEEILPEPGTLETGRAYREKKAKPLLAQIVKVLRSLYLAYVELRGKFERLQGDYGRVRESNIRLSDRLQEVKLENKAMRQVSADYERVKRAFGPEQVDRILEAAYQQEHAEKERKRAAKSKIRIDAR